VVSLGEWTERERLALKRAKIEEVLVSAHRATNALEEALTSIAEDRSVASPELPLLNAMGRLYLPELQQPFGKLLESLHSLNVGLARSRGLRLEAYKESMDAATAGRILSPDQFELAKLTAQGAGFSAVQKAQGDLLKMYETVTLDLRAFGSRAADLMAETTAVRKK
jgi:hypothetical protein